MRPPQRKNRWPWRACVGQQTYKIASTSSCSWSSFHTFATNSSPAFTPSRVQYVSSFSPTGGREPFHGPSVEALVQNQTQQSWTTQSMAGSRDRDRRASCPKGPHRRSQCWRGLGGTGVSYVEEFRKQAGGAAPRAELVLISIIIVSGRRLGRRLPVMICTCVATGFPGHDSSAADRRNWFRGNSLLSCVGRSVGGERRK
jgi:hypothetical protein